MKAKLTISRPSFGDGREVITLRIKDEQSGVTVTELHIGYSEFAQVITGLSEVECEIEKMVSENDHKKLGKKKVTQHVSCERNNQRDIQKQIVLKDFADNYSKDGWEIWADGTGSQQRGEQHTYILVKWEN